MIGFAAARGWMCAASQRHRGLRGGTLAVVSILAALVLLAPVALATTRIPYPPEVREKIELVFLEDGRPSRHKLAATHDMLDQKRDWLKRHVMRFERLVGEEKKKKARRTAEGRDSIVALELALTLLERMETEEDEAEIYRLGAQILTLDFATRIYQYPLGSIQMPTYIKNLLVDWDADAKTKKGDGPEEATNLVDPATGEFYTPAELDEMIADGVDISKLDPPGDGMLWRPWPEISRVDVVEAYLGGGDALHEGSPVVFPPDGESFVLHKIRMTQTKPKVDAFWYDDACRALDEKARKSCRRKFKLKFGAESHSDPVANSLMRAIGFNTDVSMHIKQPKLYLGDWNYETFRRDWENYFDQKELWTRMDLPKALLEGEAGHDTDEAGEFLQFTAAGIEYKPDSQVRVGGWSNGLIDRAAVSTGMREARALMIFNVWIANTDTKDAENNKVILRQDPDGEWKMFMNLQDAGNAFGLVLAEKVDAYPWDAVEQGLISRAYGGVRGRIELNYFGVQNTGQDKFATHADIRWGVRLIAQLTRSQIDDAVSLGRFPGSLGQLYVEKLINRRNQLVEAFGLSDEFEPIPVDRKLTTEDGSVVKGKVKIRKFPEESPVDLGHHWRSLATPIGPVFWRFLRTAVAGGVSAIDSVGGTVDLDGTTVKLYPDLLINLSRDVRPNPSPEGELDQFIVQDTFVIGARLGVGNIGQGRLTARRIYKLAYTAPSQWQGKLYDNQALNWFLPLKARRGKLPDRYVLLRDTQVGPGLAVTAPDPSDEVTGGGDLSLDFLYDWRTVIDKRPEGSAVWINKGPTVSGEGRVWLKIFPIRITFLRAQLESGWRNGDTFMLDREMIDDDALEDAVSRLRKGDSGPTRDLGAETHRKTSTRYLSFFRKLNLFFVKWNQRDRRDRIEFADASGVEDGHQVQSMRHRNFQWSFFDNGEAYTCSIEGFLNPGKADDDGDPHWGDDAPVVVASYLIDDLNSHSDELDDYYTFLSELGGGKHLFPKEFSAEQWEQTGQPNGRWGRLLVEGQLVLRRDALSALADLDTGAYWAALARSLEIEPDELQRLRRRMGPINARRRLLVRRNYSADVYEAIRTSEKTLRALRAAADAGSTSGRLTDLVQALQRASCFSNGRIKLHVVGLLMDQIKIGKLAKKNQSSARARIGTAVADETKLPERRDFVGRLGKRHLLDQRDVIAEPFDPIELYNMLDWIRGEPKEAYVTPEVLR